MPSGYRHKAKQRCLSCSSSPTYALPATPVPLLMTKAASDGSLRKAQSHGTRNQAVDPSRPRTDAGSRATGNAVPAVLMSVRQSELEGDRTRPERLFAAPADLSGWRQSQDALRQVMSRDAPDDGIPHHRL